MLDKIRKYGLLTAILFAAFILSNILMSEVFINKSPKVRPQIGTYLIARIKKVFSPSEFIASITGKTQKEKALAEKEIQVSFNKLQEVAFTEVVPGVKARASENVSETSYDLGGVKWVKHKVTIDGIEHEYGWPEGKELPPQSMLENMFR